LYISSNTAILLQYVGTAVLGQYLFVSNQPYKRKKSRPQVGKAIS
jgi:hypothetical protein